ncbi:MAG TPA: hypothetical protein VK212_06035 [Lentimicrobium sp.]|nr:hypothetical protein [Lentimicrobium sp.]
MAHHSFRIAITISVFLLMISFPLLNKNLKFFKDIESSENRAPAELPELNINRLDGFPTKYDKYYNDHFSLRQILIKYYNLLNLVVFKKSPTPQVIIGKSGWFFMGGNEDDSYRGMKQLTNEELEQLRLELEYRTNYLEQRKIKFYLAIAPAKANIYHEKVPNDRFIAQKPSWGEQLNNYLKSKSSVRVVDLYSALNNAKSAGLVYYKIDNHWNERGAFYAATKILSSIHHDIPEVNPLRYEEMLIKDSIRHNGNIAGMLSNISLYSDSVFMLTPKRGFASKVARKNGYPIVQGFAYGWEYENVREIPERKSPRLLVISDSFGSYIFPFLSEQFGRSVKIFDAWQYKLNEDIITNEQPDVVLLLVLESNIKNILQFQSRLNNQIAQMKSS